MRHQFKAAVKSASRPILFACFALATCASPLMAYAEDWGVYLLVPASAQGFALEGIGSATSVGTVVSIAKLSGTPSQKWIVTSKGNGLYTISPAGKPNIVLAASKGGEKNGTAIVLETDSGEPWQQWKLTKNDNGSYTLVPKHAGGQGLDHLGGVPKAGTQIDLWVNNPGDQHLQWFIKPLAGSGVGPPDAGPTDGASTYHIPEIKPEDVPKGEVKSFNFTESVVFPGTVRQVSVFIPAQYNAKKPACVYVKTDGYNPHEKAVLETLIATKEIPVTVGVFVRPGDVPPNIKDALGRRNRCFEYDGMGDKNVRFLVDELLPYVAKQFNLNLSTSGNDRCIAGASSGGIAAFNVAWERPEAFSRVYANSGSFVAFRGGHEFPTLVRKFEAKPIRSYLTTGMRDMENCAGDWYLIDLEMDKALKFSGYDYIFRVINGGHGAGYYDHFPEAMSYIWKGWPEPVKAGPSAPRAQDILIPGENWQLVAKDRHDARGPASNAAGEVFFVEPKDNTISRLDVEGHISKFASDAGSPNSLSVGAKGDLYAVSSETGKVTSYDASGKSTLVTDGLRGQYVLATPGGGLFVTSNGDKAGDGGTVWFLKDGKKTQVDSGLKAATGLAYRPDQWLLSVADGNSKWVYSYQINSDGTLTNKERFFQLHVADWDDDAGAESVCYAKEGQMFVGTRFGVQVCADDGPTQVILPVPDRARVIGVCLGGRDQDTLFAFCGDKIWKRKVKNHAIGAFSPFARPNFSRL